MFKRLLQVVALSSFAVLLASCSQNGLISSMGYTVGSRYSDNIRTIRVPIFRNRTTLRGIEYELTQAVVQRINMVTPWKVVQGPADAELVGTVVLLNKRVILENKLNEVREADLTLSAEVIFQDCTSGKNLMRPGEDLPPDGPNVDPLCPTQPHAHHLKPTLVQRSAPFIVDLGESYASARARVVQELAVQIVNMMETPW